MTKWVLFLAVVIVSLPMPALSDEVGFEVRRTTTIGNDGPPSVAPDAMPSAVLFNGSFTGAHSWTSQVGMTSGRDHRGPWHHNLSDLGNGQGVFGRGVKDTSGVSGDASFFSIVNVDDGVINISVPEPETMGTLAIGMGMIACLIGHKRRKPIAISKSFLH